MDAATRITFHTAATLCDGGAHASPATPATGGLAPLSQRVRKGVGKAFTRL
jgi:hypothetical protein